MPEHYRVPFLVGNTLFRDHQYWPTVTRAKLIEYLGGDPITPDNDIQRTIDLQYPVSVNLKQLMMLYWRVRTWTMDATIISGSCGAYDSPVIDQSDVAEINFSASFPSWDFHIQRNAGMTPFAPRDIGNEQEIAANWDNSPQATDYPKLPAPHVPIWKTNRNKGNFTAVFDNPDGNPDPDEIDVVYSFTEPYNHAKFGEGGTISGLPSAAPLLMLYDLVLYDSDTKMFKPQIFFGIGGIKIKSVSHDSGLMPLEFALVPETPIATGPLVHPPDADATAGSLTINFGAGVGLDPLVIPLKYTSFILSPPVPGGVTRPGNTASVDFVLNATEFWPWKNSLDELCDNGTTGAPIHNYFA